MWTVQLCRGRPYPFDTQCCHTGTAIKHSVPDRVKPSFVVFDIRALWRSGLSVRVSGCQKRLNPVWHRMLYSCTRMATVDIKGLNWREVKSKVHCHCVNQLIDVCWTFVMTDSEHDSLYQNSKSCYVFVLTQWNLQTIAARNQSCWKKWL